MSETSKSEKETGKSGTELLEGPDIKIPGKSHNFDFSFEDIVSSNSNKLEGLIREDDKEFNDRLAREVVKSTVNYMNRENLGLAVEVPRRIEVDPDKDSFFVDIPSVSDKIKETPNSSPSYFPSFDTLYFDDYSEAVYAPNSFHDLLHQGQIRRYTGDFESDDPLNVLNDFYYLTNSKLRNDLIKDIQLENNNDFKRYIILLSLRRSEKIPKLLKNVDNFQKEVFKTAKRLKNEIYLKEDQKLVEKGKELEELNEKLENKEEELKEEIYKTIDDYDFDDKPVKPLMEAFASFSSMYFRGVLEDRSERDTYLRLTSKNYGFGGEFKSYIKELFENYDSYKGSKKEKFRKVMKDQDEFFERI